MRVPFGGARLRPRVTVATASGCLAVAGGAAQGVQAKDDTPILKPGSARAEFGNEEAEAAALQRDYQADTKRAGDRHLTNTQVAKLHAAAVVAARKLGASAAPAQTFDSAWTNLGPNPIVTTTRSDNSFYALSGRIGALAIRPSNHEFILGAAQGGIWTYDRATGTWTPRTDDQTSLATGALAVAPSDDTVIYAGTGEGALSGDSQAGNG